MRTNLIAPIFILLLFAANANGQISSNGIPTSSEMNITSYKQLLAKQPSEKVDPFLQQKSAPQSGIHFKNYKYGERLALEIDILEDGELILDDGNRKVWLLKVKSEGARSISLIFGNYHLVGTARLFAYSPDKEILLGAFTAANNKESKRFVISPIPGEECIIELEVPYSDIERTEAKLSAIIHDFTGIVAKSNRPLGKAGSCNIEVGCVTETEKLTTKNATIRLLSNGELCTGALINNSNNNATPYIITANHCISNSNEADESIFYFNYESPFCGTFDGDPAHTISGSTFKTGYTQADFALVQLTKKVPAKFQPYFAGWNIETAAADSTYCWHHPRGDNKKCAIDRDSPTTASWNENFLTDNFWNILRWDVGTTEIGSSGSPLFNSKNQLVGTLSAGAASCSNPVNDLYSKLTENWQMNADGIVPLRNFLDPGFSKQSIDGIDPFKDDNCDIVLGWSGKNIALSKSISDSEGYFAGKNSLGWNEIIQHFNSTKLINVDEIEIGIGVLPSSENNSLLELNIYNGGEQPGRRLYSQLISISTLTEWSMNKIALSRSLVLSNDFYIGLNWGQSLQGSISFLHTYNLSATDGFKIRNTQNEVIDILQASNQQLNGHLAMQIHGCNIEYKNDNPLNITESQIIHTKNTRITKFLVIGEKVEKATYYDLSGREILATVNKVSENEYHINGLSNSRKGIYIIRIITNKQTHSKKIFNR